MVKKTVKEDTVMIPAANIVTSTFKIKGISPLVQHKFSTKVQAMLMEKHEKGSQSKKGAKKEGKDWDALYKEATHFSEEGWAGIHAGAFRSAMISACRLVGFQMTKAKLAVFIVADGIDEDEGTPLVRIYGKSEKHIGPVRLETGVVDIRCRPMWRQWSCNLNIRYDADLFSATDIANLLSRVGMQVGIGEGRPDSKKSHGCGWGMFEIA